jgi:GDP-L-fucose synthase
MLDPRAQRVIVTGGAGFLGRAVCANLLSRGVERERLFVPRRKDFDLTTPEGCRGVFAAAPGATLVVHCAAFVGGLGANRAFPARLFHDNMAMALHLVEAARVDGFCERGGRILQVGTMCSYPADAPLPFHEDSLFRGLPDAEIAAYGLGKLAALGLLKAYHRQHGLKGSYCPLVNLYGPGDNLDDPAMTHVAGAFVGRFVDAARAGTPEVVCWGTGSPTRDFIYVDDAAEGLVRAALTVEDFTPVNIASGREVSIRELAETIARLSGYTGRIVWDASKGDGVGRRCLDVRRARELLGWSATTGLEEGFGRTIAWYTARGKGAPAR